MMRLKLVRPIEYLRPRAAGEELRVTDKLGYRWLAAGIAVPAPEKTAAVSVEADAEDLAEDGKD